MISTPVPVTYLMILPRCSVVAQRHVEEPTSMHTVFFAMRILHETTMAQHCERLINALDDQSTACALCVSVFLCKTKQYSLALSNTILNHYSKNDCALIHPESMSWYIKAYLAFRRAFCWT